MNPGDIRELADEILCAIKKAKPYEWAEWDVFSGRQNYRKQPQHDAELNAICDVLQRNLSRDATGKLTPTADPSTTTGVIRS